MHRRTLHVTIITALFCARALNAAQMPKTPKLQRSKTQGSSNSKFISLAAIPELTFENVYNSFAFYGQTPSQIEHVKALFGTADHPEQLINQQDVYSGNTLVMATIGKYPVIAAFLMQQPGFKPNIQNKEQETSLLIAIKKQDPHSVKTLIELGADITIKDRVGWSALDWAFCYSSPQISPIREILSRAQTPDIIAQNNLQKEMWLAQEQDFDIKENQ